MKDKYTKFIATGLLSLMIANFSACDEINIINRGNNLNDVTSSTEGNDITPSTSNHGDIWEGLKSYQAMNRTIFPYDLYNIEGNPIPIQFLKDQGLIYTDDRGRLKVNTDYTGDSYQQFRCFAYVDDNTTQNDVYLLLQYQSGKLNQNASNPDVYLATWKLKYNLSDEDYNTFLSMQNDWRIRLFVQEMDNIYEPEVISNSIIRQDLLHYGSHVRFEHWTEQGFPNIFVDSIDYNNAIITYGTATEEGLKYYDLDIRNTEGWKSVMHKYGFTAEECEDKIHIEIMDTLLGPCLTKFNVHYQTGGYSSKQAQEAFDTTNNVYNLRLININETDNIYTYNPDKPPLSK